MRQTLWGGLVCFFSDDFWFCFPRPSDKSLRDWNTPSPYTRPESDSRFSLRNVWLFGQSPRPTFVFHPHLPLGRLLFSSHICLSDDFWFAPMFAFLTTFVSLHSSAETSFLLDFYIRFPPIFAFQQSSFSTNLRFPPIIRLRIFHALVTHNLVYPELFFVPMSISTVE